MRLSAHRSVCSDDASSAVVTDTPHQEEADGDVDEKQPHLTATTTPPAAVGTTNAAGRATATSLGAATGFGARPLVFWPILAAIVAAYLTLVEIAKRAVDRHEARGAGAIRG